LWASILKLYGIKCTQIHSFLSQIKRTRNLNKFKEGRVNILLTTDLGSRGLDIRTVGLVINYDFPIEYVDYVHRAGRTARGIQRGKCVSLITQHDVALLNLVEEKVDMKIEVYKKYDEDVVLKEMNKLDKTKRKLKIKFMINGKYEKFQKITKDKKKFQLEIKNDIDQKINHV
jgi:ATP-dependent RNA helicase DDX49/DBP8